MARAGMYRGEFRVSLEQDPLVLCGSMKTRL